MLTTSPIAHSTLRAVCKNASLQRTITSSIFIQHQKRPFSFTSYTPISSTSQKQLVPTQPKQFELSKPKERYTKPSWPHPVYSREQMAAIEIAHRETKNWSDWIAITAVKILRTSFDLMTGYRHDKEIALGNKDPAKGQQGAKFAMTGDKWMVRFIFLESIAGVPGFVAGTLRHLKSLRTLNRDNGWIETLLEEGYNERMHLLTFLRLHNPGWFMRMCIIGAQGIFYNGFFISYLISPRTCHRFVGYLEEEAVITYTRAIADIEAGKLPEWKDLKAPEIAIQYWNMEKDSTMKNLLYYIRADEAKHREVNHTLANLDPKSDPNPFLTTYEDPTKPHPSKTIEYLKSKGWERDEVLTK